MPELESIKDLWFKKKQYLQALSDAWNWTAGQFVMLHGSGISLSELVFRACQQAAATHDDKETQNVLRVLLAPDPPLALLIFDGRETEDLEIDGERKRAVSEETIRLRHRTLRACLLATRVIPQHCNVIDIDSDLSVKELNTIADETTDLITADRFSVGFLRSLTRELWPPECKRAVAPVRDTLTVRALLVKQDGENERGVIADLQLDLLPDGSGDLFPAPGLALRFRDDAFVSAATNARAALHKPGLLSDFCGFDVRYSLRLRGAPPTKGEDRHDDAKTLPGRLVGPSLGVLLALAAGELVGRTRKDWVKLDFSAVTATGTIDADGNLGAVGGVWEKLLAAIEKIERTQVIIRTFLIASAQREQAVVDPELNHALERWLEPFARPIQAICAPTLADAFKRLHEHFAPRVAVLEEERERSSQIHFLGGTRNMDTHFVEILLHPPLRPEDLPKGEDGKSGRPRDDSGEPLGRSHEKELDLRRVGIRRAEDEKPCHWPELITDYAKLCPEAAKQIAAANGSGSAFHLPGTGRALVIGSPGAGKSTLERRLAWSAATEIKPFDQIRLLPASVSLREWEQEEGNGKHQLSLAEFLTAVHPASKRQDGPKFEHWRDWLDNGGCLLLLDGLDEVRADFFSKHSLELESLAAKHFLLLTCRSLNREQYQKNLDRWPIFTLRPLTAKREKEDQPSQQEQFIRHYPKGSGGKLDPAKLLAELDRLPQLRDLAEVPALLDVICFVVDRGLQLPATRSELYDKAVDELLIRRRGSVAFPTGPEPSVRKQRLVLARTLLALFARRALALFPEKEFEELAEAACVAERIQTDAALWAAAFQSIYCDHSGLVRFNTAGGDLLHNSFFEFLAAEGLCLPEPLAASPHTPEPFAKKVVRHVDDVAKWREVIKFAAGIKFHVEKDPRDAYALVTELAGPADPTDDLGWRKVVLAGEVLVEIGVANGVLPELKDASPAGRNSA